MKKKKQIVVFGLGRFGAAVAHTLSEMGHEVLAVDSHMDAINEISPYVTHAVQLNATDEAAFESLDVGNFDAAVVSIGENIRDSVLISMLCKEAGVKLVVSKANDELHAKVLKKVGVDRVVFAERDMGVRVAKSLIVPHLVDLVNIGGDYALAQITVPESWVDKTLAQLDVRRRWGVSIITVNRNGQVNAALSADTRLLGGDQLLILGLQKDVEKVENLE
ncbi:MAG: TrkA family potassium uptake protein [Clostridia bacterium]|nr:TrkA family potassium uptake protein [Clostridia bacterium]